MSRIFSDSHVRLNGRGDPGVSFWRLAFCATMSASCSCRSGFCCRDRELLQLRERPARSGRLLLLLLLGWDWSADYRPGRLGHHADRVPVTNDNRAAIFTVPEQSGVVWQGIRHGVGEANNRASADAEPDHLSPVLIIRLVVGVDLNRVSVIVVRQVSQWGMFQISSDLGARTLGSWEGRRMPPPDQSSFAFVS